MATGVVAVSIASVTNPLSTLVQALGRLFEHYAFGRVHTSSRRPVHFSSYISFLCQMYQHVKSELENSFITFDVKINFFNNTIYIYMLYGDIPNAITVGKFGSEIIAECILLF